MICDASITLSLTHAFVMPTQRYIITTRRRDDSRRVRITHYSKWSQWWWWWRWRRLAVADWGERNKKEGEWISRSSDDDKKKDIRVKFWYWKSEYNGLIIYFICFTVFFNLIITIRFILSTCHKSINWNGLNGARLKWSKTVLFSYN